MAKGLIHIYCGEGKGKTTAAIGLGVRAYGRGLRVLLVQFLKDNNTGEIESIQKFLPGFEVLMGKPTTTFVKYMNDDEKENTAQEQERKFELTKSTISSEDYDLLILDEVIAAVNHGMIAKQDLLDFLQQKPEKLEVVLTGRYPDDDLAAIADYVSEIKKIKHPKDAGIRARLGIER